MRSKCLGISMGYTWLAAAMLLVMTNAELGVETRRHLVVRDLDGRSDVGVHHETVETFGKRQDTDTPVNWNDARANPVGINQDLGWNYDFCRIEFPRTAVVDQKLYIDGGMVWLSQKGEGVNSIKETNTRLLEIDLSQPITQENYTVRTITKPSSIPNVGAGQVFLPPNGDNASFYLYGGYFPSFNKSLDTYVAPPENPSGDIVSYDRKSDKWEKVLLAEGSDKITWGQEGTSISIPEQGLAFYVGAYQNSSSNSVLKGDEYRTMPGFLKLEWDMDNPTASPRLTNDTNVPFDPIIGASLLHIPEVGEKGILVMLGGYSMLPGNNQPGAWNTFDNIYIYNIAKEEWYQQQATTNETAVPKNRGYTCTVMVPAEDKSSFNIYMYGGGGRGGGAGTDDMWILTLPSFTWINLWVQGDHPSVGASCHLLNNNQILHVGPRKQRKTDTCAPLWSVFDISQSKWVTKLDPFNTNPAPVHRSVREVIGGDGFGGSKIKTPPAGWDNEKMKELFATRPKATTTTTPTTSTSTSSSTNSPDSVSTEDTSNVNRGAIIGGVAGGLVALLVLIGCFIQRKRRSRHANGFSLFGRKLKSEPVQELEATLIPPPEYLDGRDIVKQPPQEMMAPYPWAAREGMGEAPPLLRGELEGGCESQYEEAFAPKLQQEHQRETLSPTPPPETHRAEQHPVNAGRPVVRRKPVEGGAVQEKPSIQSMHQKSPSSRFSEDL